MDGLGGAGFAYAVYGLTLVLLGVAVAVSRRFGAWIGSVAVAAGSLSLAIGIDVAYRGSETEFYELSSVAYQLLVLVFVVGILIAEVRPRSSSLEDEGAMKAQRSQTAWTGAPIPLVGFRDVERPKPAAAHATCDEFGVVRWS